MTDLRAPLTKGCRYIFLKDVGSGCGSVGRAVASDPEVCGSNPVIGKIYIEHLFTVNCIEKIKMKKKRPEMAHFKKIFLKDYLQPIISR